MASNQKYKLLLVGKFLYEETDESHKVSMTNILEYLKGHEVIAERKSIYDDISLLKLMGMDICSEKIEHSYVYYVASRNFELPELKLLVDTIQSSKFITQKKSKSLIKKISSLTSRPQADELYSKIEVINRVKVNNEKIYYNVDAINKAINSKKKIIFYYLDWVIERDEKISFKKIRRRDGMQYSVSPKSLMWDDENYYLVAYDDNSQKVKHYRVDKMENIEVLHVPAKFPKNLQQFDSGLYAKQVFGMYGGELTEVKLKFSDSLIGVAIDRFSDKIKIESASDNSFVFKTSVLLSSQFYGWIFSLGSDVEILSPKKARNEFSEYIEKVGMLYE